MDVPLLQSSPRFCNRWINLEIATSHAKSTPFQPFWRHIQIFFPFPIIYIRAVILPPKMKKTKRSYSCEGNNICPSWSYEETITILYRIHPHVAFATLPCLLICSFHLLRTKPLPLDEAAVQHWYLLPNISIQLIFWKSVKNHLQNPHLRISTNSYSQISFQLIVFSANNWHFLYMSHVLTWVSWEASPSNSCQDSFDITNVQ